MRYALLICDDENATTGPDGEARVDLLPEYAEFGEKMGARGVLQGGERLRPTSDATTVRVRNGDVLTLRRSVRGDEGADRRVLPRRLQGPRRGDRDRLSDPECTRRLDRGEADLGHVGGVEAAVADAFHEEWGRVVATLIRVTGDWDLAEECAQDAFARALERWPGDGVPRNPGAWLTTTARNRARDRLRRDATGAAKLQEVAVLTDPDEPTGDESGVADDRLRLMFTCCHPALVDRRPGRAHAAHARRTHDCGDRTRVPHARADHGATARAGEAQDPQRGHPLPRAAGAPAPGAHRRGARGPLPALQRGLCRERRPGPGARRPLRRGDPPGARAGASSCPTSPRRSACSP